MSTFREYLNESLSGDLKDARETIKKMIKAAEAGNYTDVVELWYDEDNNVVNDTDGYPFKNSFDEYSSEWFEDKKIQKQTVKHLKNALASLK